MTLTRVDVADVVMTVRW